MNYKNIVLNSFPEAICKEVGSSGFGKLTVYYVSVMGRFPSMLGSPAATRNKAWEFAFNELQLMMLEKLES